MTFSPRVRAFFLRDKNILILIFINAVVIFLSGFEFSESTQATLTTLDTIFTIAFIIEAAVKIKEWGKELYFSQGWNMFDFILVAISIPSLLILFLDLKLVDVSFLLVFRTLRVFKIFRFFNFIPDIGNLMKSIQAGFRASVLIIISFACFIFVTAILSNNLFGSHEIFKDPGTSLYSSLKLFTIEGWYEVPDELTEVANSSWEVFFIRTYFVIIVIMGGIFGLSFVNAVLVDSMVLDNNEDLENKVDHLKNEISELKDLIRELNQKTDS